MQLSSVGAAHLISLAYFLILSALYSNDYLYNFLQGVDSIGWFRSYGARLGCGILCYKDFVPKGLGFCQAQRDRPDEAGL